MIAIAGVKISAYQGDYVPTQDDFILEEGNECHRIMEHLALAVSCHRPVLLRGPTGCGKTAIIETLARRSGRIRSKFFKVQLGQETDSRVLLGGYQVTDLPGQFLWKPGVLTQAVMEGHWILLEDIDAASSDVVTLVTSLMKNGSMSVPGLSDNIQPHPDLQLFATKRTFGHDAGTSNPILPDWLVLDCPPLGEKDLSTIVVRRWPQLGPVRERLVSLLGLPCWLELPPGHRKPNPRALFRLCERASDYYVAGNTEFALRLFQDAVDLMCGSLPKTMRTDVSEQIGLALGIVKNKAHFLSSSYKPTITTPGHQLCVGRAVLDKGPEPFIRGRRAVYSLTRPSCCLMEQVACCLGNWEPVLLVGETGCGKTASLQYLAESLNKKLTVINMSQQSETVDLLGGFKPVTFKWLMKPICDEFERMFREMFDSDLNKKCWKKISRTIARQKWNTVLDFMIHVQKRAVTLISEKTSRADDNTPKKKKTKAGESGIRPIRLQQWEELGKKLQKLTIQMKAAEKSLIFCFVEGTLVKAVRNGDWVLLDEINLASSETLDCLHGLLEGRYGSLALLERGDFKPVARDQGFRLFAAMNPATDVGKAQLPVGLRNRFTEFFVDELDSEEDLLPIINSYLHELNPSPKRQQSLAQFYLKMKRDSQSSIMDGNGKPPHYSLRSLCRALMVTSKNPCANFPRSLFEGLCLSFLTQLDKQSYERTFSLVLSTVVGTGEAKSILRQPIPRPMDVAKKFVEIEGYWVSVGTLEPAVSENYILTDTVKRHLKDLLRVVSLGKGIPVLLEGDTSVGKTSLVSYLAKCTGNVCARLNNHEHTDIQEYIGTYVADDKGKLVFKEGVLCEAMRRGYWLILDELNLAPTEVLEALNRVLDDNRELFVAETQTVIKAHPGFQLFATQNPTGLYGGRKELSRAFRNRFVELHISQIPPDELTHILHKRCSLPMGYCKKMVAVMGALQLRRRGSEIFVGKTGFITLRDLFRWGERYQLTEKKDKFYDWEQHLADEGYILLTGRVRVEEERQIIRDVLLKQFKKNVDPQNLFSLHENTSSVTRVILEKVLSYSCSTPEFQHIVWTYSLRRLAVLVCKAIDFKEPVLLVGETGCGKTSVVQILAAMHEQKLYSVNCHMHSESADFLGGLRPVRDSSRGDGKLFEWVDGPLVTAVLTGAWFLADEISLADDSVLERLNSLLEPERTLLLVEKGGALSKDQEIQALPTFSFVGTMNPGGDYGKKELSPALRNRMTEIWAGVTEDLAQDYQQIAAHNLRDTLSKEKEKVAAFMVDFIQWFKSAHEGRKVEISVRDLLTWVDFLNKVVNGGKLSIPLADAIMHGCLLTFLDSLSPADGLKTAALKYLEEALRPFGGAASGFIYKAFFKSPSVIGSHPFYITVGPHGNRKRSRLIYRAPTTLANVTKVLRGLQTGKAILMEGSPGVGKTSLIEGLAKDAGVKLTRINLSEQTDVSDLFGADLPVEGGGAGHFEWRDGPFLSALKEEHWILLDELNLASQSALEGLNAVLDHRGQLFIPELNRTFTVPTGTRLFACQNPLGEGGNRRGLPRSFLNRFTRIYIEPLTAEDYQVILGHYIPIVRTEEEMWKKDLTSRMTVFSERLNELIAKGKLGVLGGPWELNLRDLIRWCTAIAEEKDPRCCFRMMKTLYMARFRTEEDKALVLETYRDVGLPGDDAGNLERCFALTKTVVVLGDMKLPRNSDCFWGSLADLAYLGVPVPDLGGTRTITSVRPLVHQLPLLYLLARCVHHNWLPILVGDRGTGKTCLVQTLAAITGHRLRVMPVSSAMDTTEILGGFEQAAVSRHVEEVSTSTQVIVFTAVWRHATEDHLDIAEYLVAQWAAATATSTLPVDGESPANSGSRLEMLSALLNLKEVRLDRKLEERCEQVIADILRVRKLFAAKQPTAHAGQFEWVDSPLVKSLQDGSWLLLEDVNLCSNAVLDRLNAVVEPNGVLSIGERGALPDGSVFTVTPHKDFRLFFTMNPRNGAISRAMRNRGVEIHLADDANVQGTDLDISALVRDKDRDGVMEAADRDAIVSAHKQLLPQENFHLGNLAAAAFWTTGYLKQNPAMGIEAATRAFRLVYGRDVVITKSQSPVSPVKLDEVRPPVSQMIWGHDSVRVIQANVWVKTVAQCLARRSVVGEAPAISSVWAIGFHILNVYMTISPSLVEKTKQYLDIILASHPFVKNLSDVCASIFLPAHPDDDEPWDLRWYGHGPEEQPNANCRLAWLKYQLMLCSAPPPEPPSQPGDLMLAQYCDLASKNEIRKIFEKLPTVETFLSLLDSFNEFLDTLLRLPDARWSNEALEWFLDASRWAVRLRHLGSAVILRGGKAVDETLIRLELHLLWFRKHLLDPFSRNRLPVLQVTPELEKFPCFIRKISDNTFFLPSCKTGLMKDKELLLPVIYLLVTHPRTCRTDIENSSRKQLGELKTFLHLSTAIRQSLGNPSKRNETVTLHLLLLFSPTRPKLNKEDINKQAEFLMIADAEGAAIESVVTLANAHTPSVTAAMLSKEAAGLRRVLGAPTATRQVRLAVQCQVPSALSPIRQFIFNLLATKIHAQIASGSELEEVWEMARKLFNELSSSVGHSLDTFSQDNLLEQKVNLLRLTDQCYGFSASMEAEFKFLPLHQPVVTTECLSQLFPSTPVNLFNVDSHQAECLDMIVILLSNCLGISKVWEDELARLKGEMELMSNVDQVDWAQYGMSIVCDILDELGQNSSASSKWVALGALQLAILSSTGHDPIRKKLMKMEFAELEVSKTRVEIDCHKRSAVVTSINTNHIYVRCLERQLAKAEADVQKHGALRGLRRPFQVFQSLRGEFSAMVSVVLQRTVNLLKLYRGPREDTFLRKVATMCCDISARVYRLEQSFLPHFPDIVLPHLNALQQMVHGLNLMMYEHPAEVSAAQARLANLCRFPLSQITVDELKADLEWLSSLPGHNEGFSVTVLTTALQALVNERILVGCNVTKPLLEVCAYFVDAWREQEEEKEQKEREKESLYLIRGTTKCVEPTEVEELEEEQQKLFPSYHQQFEPDSSGCLNSELKTPTNAKPESVHGASLNLISPNCLDQVRRLHTAMVNSLVRAPWIVQSEPDVLCELIKPLQQRHAVLNAMIQPVQPTSNPSLLRSLRMELDEALMPGLLVAMAESHKLPEGSLDFYNGPNVAEATRCIPLLQSLSIRLQDLRSQWPDHVTLIEIERVLVRVMSLPRDSPVMCFLTGMEYLLKSCQQWEQCAHSSVSLADTLDQLTQLILSWRKMEIMGWKTCLDTVRQEMKKEASKWWFHLWSLVAEFFNGPETTEMDTVLQTLVDFMETSPLGEFTERLHILQSFHAHILVMPCRSDELAMRIWNLSRFYGHFSEAVEKKIVDVTSPLVKKLQEFVKISKWNNISYWSVMQAIDKSHRTLTKFIKEYKKLLQQKVELLTMDPTVASGGEEPSPAVQVDLAFRLLPNADKLVEPLSGAVFGKPVSLLHKTSKFCKESVLRTSYPYLLDTANSLVGEVIDNLDHFSNAVPDSTLSAEKQKAQGKSQVQQKRRALADLFQTLTRLGLSYRASSSAARWNAMMLSKGPPLLPTIRGKATAEDYCVKANARFLRLQHKLLTPSKEIGPPVIERIRGFSIQLLTLLQTIHKALSLAKSRHVHLEEVEAIFASFNPAHGIPDQAYLEQQGQQLRDVVASVLYTLKQFNLILNAWPENCSEKLKMCKYLTANPPRLMLSSKNDEPFQRVLAQYQLIVSKLEKISAELAACFPSEPLFRVVNQSGDLALSSHTLVFHSERHAAVLEDSIRSVSTLFDDISKLKTEFDGDDVNPMVAPLSFSNERRMFETLRSANPSDVSNTTHPIDIRQLKHQLESAVEDLLVAVQKVVKKQKKDENEEDVQKNEKVEESEDVSDLYDNHLTGELVGSLKDDLECLNLQRVEMAFSNLLKQIIDLSSSRSDKLNDALLLARGTSPFLKQYLALSNYFIDQLQNTFRVTAKFTSVLMAVFTLVAEKGFCIPPELDDGEGLEGQEGGGLGLGEGEGKKDVSDRIESEDQLEDARPAGEEKEEKEDPDCEEEDKGIETSEDFGGKAQDMKEKEDDEDSGEEGEDEEPDKEMGETETGAEQLDKEMWDSDEEGGEEQDLREEQGGGEKFGEEEYGAKEDDDDDGPGDGKENKQKEKKDITDMEDGDDDSEQIDPNHGQFEPQPEPEPFDMPEDIQLDDQEGKDNEQEEENPFDIDEMKEPQLPPDKEESGEKNDESNEEEKEEEQPEEGNEEGGKEDGQELGSDEENNADEGGDGPQGDEQEGEDPGAKDQYQPSNDKPTEAPAQPAPHQSDADHQSTDQLVGNNNKDNEQDPQEKSEEKSREGAGVGQADEEQSSAGHDAKLAKQAAAQPSASERRKPTKRPGKSDEERALGDRKQGDAKRMRTVEKQDGQEGGRDAQEPPPEADLVQHVQDGKDAKMQALDAATEEQADAQSVPNQEDETGVPPSEEVTPMEQDDSVVEDVQDVDKLNPNKTDGQKESGDGGNKEGELNPNDTKIQTDGDVVTTQTVERGADSTLHAQPAMLARSREPMTPEEMDRLRRQIQNQLSLLKKGQVSKESATAWQLITSAVDGLSRELTEQLRLVLEPSLASRLKGDYRTGRRINMRKVISYIASEFRKDRIWLRRTRPWKREHQIVLAIDDSSSMADNKSKELAFESLALVSKALTLLEAGELSVLSFGEKAKVLHPLGEPFTEETGARLVQELAFDQKRTNMREAIDMGVAMLAGTRRPNAAQLLLMMSDGRGVFSEGLDPVRLAVRRALTAGVFIVFLIIDDPKSQHSIMDIRQPEFIGGSYTGQMKSYLESFPFPYYLILRDISALPGTLSDALRQWFQITAPPT